MMNYDVYLRNSQGQRGSYINGITALEVTFRNNQPAKWSMSGAGLEACPLSYGADIVIFRNDKVLLCGYVDSIRDQYDEKTHIYDWKVSGQSDLGKLAHRIIYSNPAAVSPDPNDVYTATGTLSNIILTVIRLNGGTQAQAERRIPHLDVTEVPDIGDVLTVESKYDDLYQFVFDKLTDDELEIREVWNLATGEWDIKMRLPQDVSGSVIFSVDNGSISAWQRTIKAPTANWLLVTGCEDENGETMSVIVSDTYSISKWGRIEAIVMRSDITRNEETSETWESVAARLQQAALEELEKRSAQFGYKLTTTEINRNVFDEDYNIGNIVAVRIADDEFTAKVKEIKIKYSKGVETIVPSVGTMQKGELQSVFTEIGTLKDQIRVLQQSALGG